MRLLAVLGTRPEAIKMAPVLMALSAEPLIHMTICTSGQHRELLDQALRFFALAPDFELDLMEPAQRLNQFAARALESLDAVLHQASPDMVVVHGDTTTALAAALAAFHRDIPIAHVEAGLRSYRHDQPRPEEMNRRTVDMMADILFAPTPAAKLNLAAERLHGRVIVTGNSGVDALHHVLGRLERDEPLRRRVEAELPEQRPGRKLILVTAHRRESFGERIGRICEAVATLAERADLDIVFPVHPNPELHGPVQAALDGCASIRLLPPLDLPSFVRLMQRSDLVLTDSGGVQEEAVSLGKPVLVMRDVTDRPEGVLAGPARLVGTRPDQIVREAVAMLEAPDGARALERPNPYGDGRASERIVAALLGRPFEEFAPTEPTEIQPVRRLAI